VPHLSGILPRHFRGNVHRFLTLFVLASAFASALPGTANARQFVADEISTPMQIVRSAQSVAPTALTVIAQAGFPAGPGPGRQAEAQYANRSIVIWRTSNRPAYFWAGAFAHELGHAVAHTHFSAVQMQQWNTMRDLSSWRWVPGTANDFSVGEGDFAEAFMSYLLGHQVRSVGGAVSPQAAAWIQANTPF